MSVQMIKALLLGKGKGKGKDKDKDKEEVDEPYTKEPTPAPDSPSEQIAVAATASKEGDDVFVRIAVNPGQGAVRTPLDICCVVDVSGSMGSSANIKNDDGKEEAHGLSVLDVVKHAVKTVIHSLQPCDRVAVVAFESSPHIIVPLTAATKTNVKNMIEQVNSLRPTGGTNLWGGLETGMELLRTDADRSQRFPALLLLTDGMPDYDPAEMLKKYKDMHPQLPTINTFGFGYQITTPMLLNIAEEGNGMHCFIPDASFVGTAFVNAITNLMVTVAGNVTVSVEPENGTKIEQIFGRSQTTSWGALIDLGSLQYAQTKDAVLRLSVPTDADPTKPLLRATVRYERATHPADFKEQDLEAEVTDVTNGGVGLQTERLRLEVYESLALLTGFAAANDAASAEAELDRMIEKANAIDDPHAKGIAQDLSGQVREALKRDNTDYYSKWGRHYLPSLARAHLLQQCNNFKDPGIQFYGGDLFHKLRDKVEDIFIKLPPPKPSAPQPSALQRGGHNNPPLQSMSTYYNASGGCIAQGCMVRMAHGSVKAVEAVTKGDVVAAGAGKEAVVVCVVETRCARGRENLVTLPGGLRITPYHPVFTKSEWKFPIDLAQAERDAPCESVYNFVLYGEGHSMIINDVECVTLGHGLTGPVIGHPYFGTQAVLDDLRAMRGWESGRIELRTGLTGSALLRDAKTGLVCGYARGADGVHVGAP